MIKDIPKAASEWKPNVCVNFLSSLLSKLKTSITEESSVHTVTWNSRAKQIQVLKPHQSCVFVLKYCVLLDLKIVIIARGSPSIMVPEFDF